MNDQTALLEAALLDYIERYGLTEKARRALQPAEQSAPGAAEQSKVMPGSLP